MSSIPKTLKALHASRAWLLATLTLPALLPTNEARSQSGPPVLTVEKIMQDPRWIGSSPSMVHWSADGKYLLFSWNPDKAPHDSVYYITREDPQPRKAPWPLLQENPSRKEVSYNAAHTAYTYSRQGDIWWGDARTGKEKPITRTVETESNPVFSFRDSKIVYSRGGNLFAWDQTSGLTEQLTNFQPGAAPAPKPVPNTQEAWLRQDQLETFQILRERRNKKDITDSLRKKRTPKALRSIWLDDQELQQTAISPDGRFITWQLVRHAKGAQPTNVPDYVTESGFTRDLPSRPKVGAPQDSYTFFVFDTDKDTILQVATGQIPGITDLPDYLKNYPAPAKPAVPAQSPGSSAPTGPAGAASSTPATRKVYFTGPWWSPAGTYALVDIRSQDNKDRWLMLLDPATGNLRLLDRQRDEAWIAGPGIGYDFGNAALGWTDEHTIWYQSEASGYSHLYTADVQTGKKTQLTSGSFEVLQASLSQDRKRFYITTNAADPGEQQFYHLPVTGGSPQRITTIKGGNQVMVSPDEQQLAILHSYSNKPWELCLQDNKAGSRPRQITDRSMSEAFRAYPWRDPEIITFKARDGALVRARIYRPAPNAPSTAAGSPGTAPAPSTAKPAVIFVHGAGYLQNAHKWWSYYFREFMFNNMLADQGYTVLDIDYRGSAGYGRDWRTGIYRHMGGKDLDDQVDGAKYLAEHEGVDPHRIGLYGGSYGGFITLMALCTTKDVFKAGAALRSVTDWAHYEHDYTANILNEPATDSLAYRRSSPIYFAEGLQGHLLMCHGMVDVNVHFQDIVRMTQRFIELGKDNWELAVYPMEDHGFVEPSSWTDEYKRIYRLFETWLK